MRVVMLRGVLGSVLILLGGLVTSRVPSSSWVAQLDGVNDLRAWRAAYAVAFIGLFVGLFLLTSAWLALGSRVRGHAGGVSSANIAAAAWALPLLVAPPLFSGDAWSYVADGYLAGHGLSPYVVTPSVLHGPIVDAVNARWLSSPAPYGPVPLIWGGLFSRLTTDPWLLMLASRALAIVGVGLLAFAVPRLARRAGRDPATAAWLVAPAPFVLAHGVGGLHNDVLLAGLMAVALLATIERGWVIGAVLGGAAAAVKVPGAFVCVGVVLLALPVGATLAKRAWRTACVAAVSISVLVGLGLVGGLGVGWVGTLGVPVSVRTPLSATTDLGVFVGGFAPDAAWSPPGAIAAAHVAGIAAVVVVAGLVLMRTPGGDDARALRGVAVVMFAVTVLSPAEHYWYALWCLPLLAAVHLRRRYTNAVTAVTLALGLVAPLDFSFHIPGSRLIVLGAIGSAVGVALLGPPWIFPEDDPSRSLELQARG